MIGIVVIGNGVACQCLNEPAHMQGTNSAQRSASCDELEQERSGSEGGSGGCKHGVIGVIVECCSKGGGGVV